MRKHLKKIAGNEYYKGGLVLTVSSLAVSFLNYIFNVLIGRTLGPQGYGEIAALYSYLAIISVPLTVISMLVIQKVGSQTEAQKEYVASLEEWFTMKLKIWWPLLAISLLIIPFTPRLTNISPLVAYLIIPLVLLSFLNTFYDASLQGLRLFLVLSATSLAMTLIKLIGPILAMNNIGGLYAVVLCILIGSITKYLVTYYSLHKVVIAKATETIQKTEKRVSHILKDKQFVITLFSILAITAFSNIDIIYAKKFFNAFDSGIYSSWALLAKIILYAVGPALTVAYIFFTSKKNAAVQTTVMTVSFIFFICIAVGMFFFYIYAGPSVIDVLFGKKFHTVTPYLGTAGIFGALYTFITFMNNYFLAKTDKAALILAVFIPFYREL